MSAGAASTAPGVHPGRPCPSEEASPGVPTGAASTAPGVHPGRPWPSEASAGVTTGAASNAEDWVVDYHHHSMSAEACRESELALFVQSYANTFRPSEKEKLEQ